MHGRIGFAASRSRGGAVGNTSGTIGFGGGSTGAVTVDGERLRSAARPDRGDEYEDEDELVEEEEEWDEAEEEEDDWEDEEDDDFLEDEDDEDNY